MADFSHERKILKKASCVAGVDEAGRGAWAGPVAVAMVILHPYAICSEIDDSKKFNFAERERLASIIKRDAVSYAVCLINQEIIDAVNILQATLIGVRACYQNIYPSPQHLLLDALKIPDLEVPSTTLIKGDTLSYSIAAASILAKSTRDKIMIEWGMRYPEYGFERHKGYGVNSHRAALQKYGYTPIHRKTFRPVREIYKPYSTATDNC